MDQRRCDKVDNFVECISVIDNDGNNVNDNSNAKKKIMLLVCTSASLIHGVTALLIVTKL